MNHVLSYTENPFIIIFSVLNKQNILEICSIKFKIIMIEDQTYYISLGAVEFLKHFTSTRNLVL